MTTNTEVHEWLDRRRRVAMGEARRYRERDPERAARARRRVTAIERVGEVLRNRPGGRSVGSLVRSRGRAEYRRDDSARRLRRRGETVARECLSLQGVQSGQRGDCYTFGVLEVAPPLVARGTYQATAGSMALVLVTRVRRYANSYHYGPSEARTVYLCGYDHGGPYAHPVHRDCRTIAAALQWAWQGYWPQVRERQGDVAIVAAAGPRFPRQFPATHRVTEGGIQHGGHGLMRLPGAGERVIVARRAADTVREGHGD